MGKAKLVFLLSGCAVLGACASTGQSGYSKDEGKIAAVEQVAKTTGTKVYRQFAGQYWRLSRSLGWENKGK
jgi:hypothetical protein